MATNKNDKLCIVSAAISINQSPIKLFQYVSDLRNDKTWRKEIHETRIEDAEIKVNTIAIEDSYLSKKVPNHKTILQCVEYIAAEKVVYQSLPEANFFLRNSRQIENSLSGTARLIYAIEFDPAIVQYGLGFRLPLFFLRYYTTVTMNRYLKTLKNFLEKGQQH